MSALNPQATLRLKKYPGVPLDVHDAAKNLWLHNRKAKPSDVKVCTDYFKATWPDSPFPTGNEKLGFWIVSWCTQVGIETV